MDRVRALRQLLLNFCFPLFYFARVSRYCRASVSSRSRQNQPDTSCLVQIDRHARLRPEDPTKTRKKQVKGTQTRAVTQHVDQPSRAKVRLLVHRRCHKHNLSSARTNAPHRNRRAYSRTEKERERTFHVSKLQRQFALMPTSDLRFYHTYTSRADRQH